jgi:hypothetical protein
MEEKERKRERTKLKTSKQTNKLKVTSNESKKEILTQIVAS